MKEIRVYCIDCEACEDERDFRTISNDDFIELAEQDGNIYTLDGFQHAFNQEEINSCVDYIRFIEVDSFN